ncbi:MAG: PKD domain-containing protein [Candidatus Gorgyraea atricola]|nr:PKD domain-containing protein [Candidatus Gorgyraea atricola]
MSRHNKGLTLIEIIVAMLILSFGIAASLKLFAVLDERMVTSSYFYTATNLARDVIEFGESVDFANPFKMLYKHAPGEKDYGSGVDTSEGYGLKEWENFDPASSIHPFALMGEIQEKELVPTETPESVEISYEVKEDTNFYKAYRQDINVSWNVKDGEQDEIKVAAIPITTNNQLKLEIQDFWWEKGKDLPVVPPPPLNKAPIANISANRTSGDAPLTVTFSGAGSEDLDGEIIDYFWKFGTGDTARGITVTYVYNSKGTYTASLTVTDDEGATDTETIEISVTEAPPSLEPPVAVIIATPTSGPEPLEVAFDASGSYDPDDANKSNLSYFWDFGHGRTTTSVQDTRSFTCGTNQTVSNYPVSLEVTDKDGKKNTASVTITVYAGTPPTLESPVAVISAIPTSGETPLEVAFDASGSYDPDDANKSNLSYFWDFGHTRTSSKAQDTRSFTCGTSQAEYPVSLTVTDKDGKTGKKSVTITVSPASGESLEADIIATPTSGPEPLTVAFDGSGSSGSIASYKWTFGDGENATGSTTSHIYNSEGAYTAELKVTDDDGEIDTASVDIEVIESGPITKEFGVSTWVNDKYKERLPIAIDVPREDTYELLILAQYTGEAQIGEKYCLQVNNGITGSIISDKYNGSNGPKEVWVSHGSYDLKKGSNTITFRYGGQPDRDHDKGPGDWHDWNPDAPGYDANDWTWYLGGSVHFKKIKIQTN